eukprot:g23313.t1
MDGSLASVMVWAVHTIFCTFLWSWAEQLPYQAIMHLDSVLSMVHLQKLVRDLMGMPNFLSYLRKKEVLLCLLDCRIDMESPGQVVGYRHSEVFDALHSLKLRSVGVDGGVFSSFLSEIDDQFFSFADLERQIVFITPHYQALYLPSAFCLIVVGYPSHYCR